MPSGFQLWNQNGDIIQDSTSDSFGRILGLFSFGQQWSRYTQTYTGTIQDSRFKTLKGTPFIIPFQNSTAIDQSRYSTSNDTWIRYKVSAMTISNLRLQDDKLLFDYTLISRVTVPQQQMYYGIY